VTRLLAIKFPLSFFIPDKFGLTRAQATNYPDLFAHYVAESLGEIFQEIGQDAEIAVTENEMTVTTLLPVNELAINFAVEPLGRGAGNEAMALSALPSSAGAILE